MPVGIELGSVASSIAGGVVGAGAAGAAAKAANNAAKQGNQILSGVQTQTTNNLQPFVGYGQNEGSALEGLLGVGGNPDASSAAFGNYLNSTNYQFQLGQGENAIKTAGAPSFNSGATAKALNNYAQGQAGSALAGYEGLLQTGSGQGIAAGTGLGQINTANATQQASNLLAAAGVQGSADIYGANAITGALKGGVSGLSSFGSPGSALAGLFGGGGSSAPSAFGQNGYAPFAATGPLAAVPSVI